MNKPLPSAILFACTMNAIRSPIAAALMHHYFGHKVYVASAGIVAGDPDPFVGMVMDEIGIDLKKHRPHSFEDLEDNAFDLVITLSPQAHKKAETMARTMAIGVENWNVVDPSGATGSREQILEGYRAVRDDIKNKILARFNPS